MPISTAELLRIAAQMGASDVHLVSNCAPMARIHGQLVPVPNFPAIPTDQCAAMIYQLMNEDQRARFEQEWTLDFSLMVDETRFRANVLLQRNGLEAVL
ncbi:MAG TPA: twitching motility protein PilT, partial [Elusimicrobiota bacterium]|nr:twitching motility protein PilT [Elusimicrobiota bacterium]